jgi:hypothetical protein
MGTYTTNSSGKKRSLGLEILIGAICLTIAALFLIPFSPVMPESGLDPSWRYALNVGLTHGYVFGRDLIFTFGPLGSVYSMVFDPMTDHIMMVGSTVYAVGLCVALALVAHPRRHLFALALPVIVSLSLARDSGFISLPFFLLLAVVRVSLPKGSVSRLEPTPLVVLGIGISTIATAITPIVKGSFLGSTVSVAGLAFVALALTNKRAAAAFAFVGGAALVSAWTLTGQPVGQLPHFFLAQGPIISGYTDGMSLSGPFWQPAIYALIALLLLWTLYSTFVKENGRLGWITLIGLALPLFIAFKAGFVRQDGHAFIAIGSLFFLAYGVSLVTKPRISLLLAAATILVWVTIGGCFLPANVSYVITRTSSVWNDTVSGIKTRLITPDALNAAFTAANEKIRTEVPLPHVAGSVDVYPTELSAIFANGLTWAGRPIFQSYSVYDPVLDAKNVAHLLSPRAPQTVFFTFAPLDRRLPSFDDSGSLLALLSYYKVVGYNSPYVRLERTGKPATAALDEAQAFAEQAHLGETIALKSDKPTWITLNVHPTLIGKLVRMAFKLPQLQIELTLDDGHIVKHRFIPAIGETGFIISPYMTNAQDFILMAAGIDGTPRVKSFKITTNRSIFWKNEFNLRAIPIAIAPQTTAKALVLTEPSAPPADVLTPVQLPQPNCHIDAVNGTLFSPGAVVTVTHDVLKLNGWVAPSETLGSQTVETWIALDAEGGNKKYFKAKSEARPDVAAALGRPDLGNSGFGAMLDLASISGKQTVELISHVGNISHSCAVTFNIQ